jgi:hypothetical protein
MLRVIETPTGVSGELIHFWATPDGSISASATSCSRWRDTMWTCAQVVESEIDWPEVAAELERLGAWTLSEPCRARRDLSSVSDAGDLLLQRLDGEDFDAYRCNAPRTRTETEAGRQALALWEYVLSWARR